MKKITLLLLVVLFGMSLKSQITVEQTYSNTDELILVKLDTVTFKYLKYSKNDTMLNLSFYNLNHSIYSNINVNLASYLPTEWYDTSNLWRGVETDAFYCSKTLFDLDSSIEFLCYFRIEYQDSLYLGHNSNIIIIFNEDGSVILSETDATIITSEYYGEIPSSIFNTNNGTKLILKVNNDCKVYSLPGTIENKTLYDTKYENELFSYPNPTKGYTTIKYQLPNGINSGEIVFYNINGTEIKRYKVDRTFDNLIINAKEFSSGTYFYNLHTTKGISKGKKLIKIK